MKHTVLIILLLLGLAQIHAQVMDAPRVGFEDVQLSRAPQELEIQIKAMIPDISVIQIKTDTYAKPGDYKYSINLAVIQSESGRQLTNWQNEINKWLEESK
ncbi:MAG: hypothetical protein K0B87_02300 [Candidatus Syntrophosphaera sp.]|nr:hypothetical protein [Candidatus Syntrophosphaera sp.]